VGEYVVMARRERGGDDWYVGALTDEKSRKVEIALDFLDANKTYKAQIYRDGDKANWQKRPYDLVIEEKTVTAKETLNFTLAESGGLAIRFVAL
jgi:alpha-glucosidase